jgi:hypothetical protein
LRILNTILLGILATGFYCDTTTNKPSDPLEIIQPKGGETYTVGQTVEIKWKINDFSQILSVAVQLSTDNGKSITYLADHSISSETTSFSWTIQTDQVSNQCFVKVYEYNDKSIYAKSGIFTVNN